MVTAEVSEALPWRLRRRMERLESRGDYRGAIDVLTQANHGKPDPVLERELVRLRHEGYCETAHPAPTGEWPPPTEDLFGDEAIPTVDRGEVTAANLAAGILGHGCLKVSGFLDQSAIERFRLLIDRALDGHDAWEEGAAVDETAPWFAEFEPRAPYRIANGRKWTRDAAGVWGVDAPRALFEYLDVVEDSGLGDVITEYLGERPAISVKKFTLRRVPVDTPADWHQDGAFLGEQTRTVNIWVTLTDCGVDAPGMDLVPARIDGLVDRGTEGAHFEWSVGDPVVERAAATAAVIRPTFSAGDALLFDGDFLHRTAASPEMTQQRYAIETWFFAPSTYPDPQIPLLF